MPPPSLDALLLQAVATFSGFTDHPELALPVAARFSTALREADGEAALEIGVRAGGMSAIFCAMAAALRPPPFLVFSVDPWGERPYMENGRDVSDRLRYGEDLYSASRTLLARFPNSVLLRLDADTFLDCLLPHLKWWHEHEEHPKQRQYLSFVYLDGRHDLDSVTSEVMRIVPHLAVNGCIMIDNVDKCRGIERRVLASGIRFELADVEENRLALTRRG